MLTRRNLGDGRHWLCANCFAILDGRRLSLASLVLDVKPKSARRGAANERLSQPPGPPRAIPEAPRQLREIERQVPSPPKRAASG
ncbi:MAG: hypothetical protein R3B13_08265 [Polyangiaceae bacterium]